MNISLEKLAPPVAFALIGFIMVAVGAAGTIPLGNPPPVIAEPILKVVLVVVGILLLGTGPVLVWREQTSSRQAQEGISEPLPRAKGVSQRDADRATVEIANRQHLPKLKDFVNQAQKEIILYAVQHSHVVHQGLGLLREKIESGCKVKILLMAAKTHDGKVNPNVFESESHRTYTGLLSQIESSTQSFQTWLGSLSEASQKMVEIRTYQQCPIVTLVIIDRDEPKGRVQVEVLLYGVDVWDAPHYTLAKEDGPNLFKAHCESFDRLWSKAEILRPANR